MSDDDRLAVAVLRITAKDSVAGDDLSWYVDSDDVLHVSVKCNDVFHWGTADAEEITWDNFELFEFTMNECIENHGSLDGMFEAYLLFCARARKMRPQGAYYKHLDSSWRPLFDAAGPARATDMFNPGKHPDDE